MKRNLHRTSPALPTWMRSFLVLFLRFLFIFSKVLNMGAISSLWTNYMSARTKFVIEKNVGHRPSRVYTVKTHTVPQWRLFITSEWILVPNCSPVINRQSDHSGRCHAQGMGISSLCYSPKSRRIFYRSCSGQFLRTIDKVVAPCTP